MLPEAQSPDMFNSVIFKLFTTNEAQYQSAESGTNHILNQCISLDLCPQTPHDHVLFLLLPVLATQTMVVQLNATVPRMA